MGMRWMGSVVIMGMGLGVFAVPSAWAADGTTDGTTAEAAPAVVSDDALTHIRSAITAETDPELKQAMEEQLKLLEAGQLDLTKEQESAHGAAPASGEAGLQAPRLTDTPPSGGFVGPPIDIGTGGGRLGNDLPPEAKAELEKLFHEKGAGDPSKDAHIREEGEKILEKYGIDPRETGPGHDGGLRDANQEHVNDSLSRGSDALEHLSPEALEHMAPEAREQLEHVYGEHSPEGREVEAHGFETPSREVYAPEQHEVSAPEQHETYAPEPSSREAPQQEAPQHDASQHEYEQPQHEGTPPPQPSP